MVDFRHGRPVLPSGHPLVLPELPESGQSSPLHVEQSFGTFAPDTVQLLGNLSDLEAELKDVCAELQFDLPLDTEVDSDCDAHFVTPFQRFASAPRFTAEETLPSAVPTGLLSRFAGFPADQEHDFEELEDMAGLQLAVLGSTGRWDGSQGPGY